MTEHKFLASKIDDTFSWKPKIKHLKYKVSTENLCNKQRLAINGLLVTPFPPIFIHYT